MKIVVVGGVGSGKSTVSKELYACLDGDAYLDDVDAMVRDIYAFPEDYFCSAQLTRWREIMEGGTIRDRIFANPELRKEVEDLTIPHVRRMLNDNNRTSNTFRIIEFPLFFEKCQPEDQATYDVVIYVTADEGTRRKRCVQRGWTPEAIDGVFEAQVKDHEREYGLSVYRQLNNKGFVFTVNTSGSLDDTMDAVSEIANFLKHQQLKKIQGSYTKIGVLGGSFDPITRGHEHVIVEAAALMDYVIVAIAKNPGKKHRFDEKARRIMILRAIRKLMTDRSKVYVVEVPEKELLASWAAKQGATTLFRGIRTGTDLEYEQTIQFVQNKVAPHMSMVHILPPRDLLEVSSSLIRGSLELREWELIVKGYVSEGVLSYIKGTL